MQFIRSVELRPGMRIAKPIYNKDGVLLYERNSKLTIPSINSIRNFDLIGIYILEPAEPLPPFTKQDIEFEQAQTIYLFKLKDIFDKIYKRQPLEKLDPLVNDIINRYGQLNTRVNFNQNLRSAHDFMYKHATSVAILTTMIARHLDISQDDYKALITSALLYGFGYRFLSRNVMDKEEEFTEFDYKSKQSALEKGLSYLSMSTDPIPYLPKAIHLMEYMIMSSNPLKKPITPPNDILLLSEVLKVSIEFDLLTGMMMGHKPQSEIMAMKYLQEHHLEFNETIISILAQCIHIVPKGASVDLSTKDKAVVLVENPEDFMRPVILRLHDNQVYDLSDPAVYVQFQIVDLMKTMDNRIEIDAETIKQFKADPRLVEMTNRIRQKLNR
ncbi:MAG: phosphohydrolase [Agathobacter sp.]|nr:phosphohydrolase [Agathobacter sp.]